MNESLLLEIRHGACSNDRRRSGWNSGGRMASAEGGLVSSEWVRYGERCSIPGRLGDPSERCELPQRGPGQSPGRKRILAYFEGHWTLFLYITKSEGDNLHYRPLLQILGELVPLVPPWSTPMAVTLAQWCRQLWGTEARAPSTFDIFTSLRSKSDSKQSKYYVVCEILSFPSIDNMMVIWRVM